ncbi:AI-2E family transporter [Patescibacteria group bacterium]|nr:AI-2E family transporter [Patescibacteria group bacterium]
MQTKSIERYFFFGLLTATLVFTFFILRPFWIILVLGVSFSIVLYPIYEWFLGKKLPSWLASLLAVLIFVLLVLGLLSTLGVIVFHQAQNAYQLVSSGDTYFLTKINTSINEFLPQGFSFDLYEKINSFAGFLTSNLASIFASIFSIGFSLLLIFMAVFYFLKDNEHWKQSIVIFSPLSDADDKKIISRFALAVNGIIRGYFTVAFVQGVMVAIGFSIFGVPNPALWGLLAIITAAIPTIGSGLISVPAIVFLYVTGHHLESLGLLLWAVGMVSTIDNILNPIIIGKKIDLPPLLILFSVLGGISLFGPVGILVGPLTISFLYTLISIYRDELKESPVL